MGAVAYRIQRCCCNIIGITNIEGIATSNAGRTIEADVTGASTEGATTTLEEVTRSLGIASDAR